MRQSVKLGVATVTATVALLGGASTASACSDDEADLERASLCDNDSAEQIVCQVGEDSESLIVNQTTNVTVGGDLNGDFDLAPE
ncbi:hypothetical protein ABT173_13210 [Streptomyces sp. NPDC001795]|uniref:hypothetical protein n=1 Tax=unclassified Streptomyces TaxID=2593676 RepID=UPI0033325AF5